MKKHIQTLQDFAAELATSLDILSESQTPQIHVLDAIRFAIERLSNQERIAAQCDQCAELEDLFGDIKPDADSDHSGTLVERAEALLELAQLGSRHVGTIDGFSLADNTLTIVMEEPIKGKAAIGDRVEVIL